ncbi:MAG: hypothetical protein AB1679_01800 [Actinomycetota bacterium]
MVHLRDRTTNTFLRPVIQRIVDVFADADCNLGILAVDLDEAHARQQLGELVDRVQLFLDPDGSSARALGVEGTPALVWVTPTPEVAEVAEGWHPVEWRHVLRAMAEKLRWSHPVLPLPGDPDPIAARPLWTVPARAA